MQQPYSPLVEMIRSVLPPAQGIAAICIKVKSLQFRNGGILKGIYQKLNSIVPPHTIDAPFLSFIYWFSLIFRIV